MIETDRYGRPTNRGEQTLIVHSMDGSVEYDAVFTRSGFFKAKDREGGFYDGDRFGTVGKTHVDPNTDEFLGELVRLPITEHTEHCRFCSVDETARATRGIIMADFRIDYDDGDESFICHGCMETTQNFEQ